MTHTDTTAGKAGLLACVATVAIGVGVLAGWLFNVEILRSLVPGVIAMNPVTAIVFIFAGISLALALQPVRADATQSRVLLLASRLAALVVILVGLLKFIGYLYGNDLPLDQWLFASRLSEGNHSLLIRIAPNTALNFLLLGTSLLLVDSPRQVVRHCIQIFVAIICLGALIAVLGHAYHIRTFYGFGKFAPMSLYTGTTFLVISGALWLAHTDSGLLGIFAGKGSGGGMARRLLPAVILVPAAFGWLELRGEEAGLFDSQFGDAVFTVGNIVVFVFLVCWSALSLQQADVEREKSEAALQWQTALLTAQVNSSIDGILVVDPNNKKILQNQRLADLFHIPRHIADDGSDENQLRWVSSVVKDSAQFVEKVLYLNAHPDESSQDEIGLKNGTTLERYSSRVVGKDGTYYGRIWTFRDISKRRIAEESFRLLNSAVIQSDEAVIITDADLDLPGPKIVFVNPAFTQMSGYTAEDVFEKTPRILQGPRTSLEVIRRLRRNLEFGQTFEGETLNYRKDGSTYEVEWKIAPLRDSADNITHFISIQRDVTERRKAEWKNRLNEERYRSLVEATAAIVWDTPPSGEFLVEQPGWTQFTGQSFEELRGWGWLEAIHPDDRAKTKHAWTTAVANQSVYEVEHRLRAKDDCYHDMMVRAVPILDQAGRISQWMGVHTDITQRKRLEIQLFQSQKLETVGKLAGGIAHEFNSILTAIIGQSELLIRELPEEHQQIKRATEINKAAVRAAALTRQLLAYGRKQMLKLEVLDLARVLTDLEGSLHHLMGPDVEIHISSTNGPKTLNADAGQLEQVIVNMALNARHAMPNGGKLTLETANVSFAAGTVGRYAELKPGDYVMLAIADNGIGMTGDVQARIFDPFFSTKEVGVGTGLGLSTCYGIIKQSGGHISVYSEVSIGTTFKIYLPQVDQLTKLPTVSLHDETMPRGTETILAVEDDPALREMVADLLSRLGYTVLAAANGVEALSLKETQGAGGIDLLFTDVVMPQMSGKELSEQVRVSSPHTKFLFTSSYTENAIVHQGVLDRGVMLLQKPFSPSALARKVRDVLDQVSPSSL